MVSTLGTMAGTVEWFSPCGLFTVGVMFECGYWFTTCRSSYKTQRLYVCVCLSIVFVVCSAVSHHVCLVVAELIVIVMLLWL